MKIGDRVRILKSTEEGIIAKIRKDKIIEIEIEDGFTIPVLTNEVVIIAPEESGHFKADVKTNIDISPVKEKFVGKKGIFLVFIPINDRILSMHLVNNSNYDIQCHLALKKGGDLERLSYSAIDHGCSLKVRDMDKIDFERWPDFVAQMIFSKNEQYTIKAPYQKIFKLKAAKLFSNMQLAPVLNKEAFLYQLDTALHL